MPPLDASSDNKDALPSPRAGLSIKDAGTAAATNLEKIYNDNGPNAAADRLRADFLDSGKDTARDKINYTQWDYEFSKLQTDAGKGDGTLRACATEWGIDFIGSLGGINQAELEQVASGADKDSAATDPYGQLMAEQLDIHYRELAGFDHKELSGMDATRLTLGDLTASEDVDERIRTYHPTPPAKLGLLEKIEDFLF